MFLWGLLVENIPLTFLALVSFVLSKIRTHNLIDWVAAHHKVYDSHLYIYELLAMNHLLDNRK